MPSQSQRLKSVFSKRILYLFFYVIFQYSPLSYAASDSRPAKVVFINDYTLSLKLPTSYQYNPGSIGIVWREGIRLAVVRIAKVHSSYLETEIFTRTDGIDIKVGDSVLFEVRASGKKQKDGTTTLSTQPPPPLPLQTEEKENSETQTPPVDTVGANTPVLKSTSTTLKRRQSQNEEEEFIPLLAPVAPPKKTMRAGSQNVFHGRIRMRHSFQTVSPSDAEYNISRVDTDATIDRIQGSAWSLLWSANGSYRDGNTFSSASDFRKVEPHLFRLMAAKKSDTGSFLRIGRLLPFELSALGFIDGVQFETPLSQNFRLGTANGAKPDRTNLDFSGKEVLGSIYGTLELGAPQKNYYSGTMGLFQTLFLGESDQTAALWDQRLDVGRKLSFYSSSQIDFDTGATKVKKGTRLTRIDFYGNSPILSFLTLKSGFNHYERPDTAAERNLSGENNLSAFDSGYWRYWAGSSQNIPWKFQLDEEVAVLKSADGTSQTQWRGGISHRGFFWVPDAYLALSGYNLNRAEGEGLGGIFTSQFPFLDQKLNINLVYGFRYSGNPGQDKVFRTSDYSLQTFWRISRAWDINTSISKSLGDGTESTVYDASLTFRW